MTGIRIACVVSEFNQPITALLHQGAEQRLLECGVAKDAITTYLVPGAIEIPLIAKQVAELKQYAAIICLGAVIRGETSHYDYVCQQVSYGCQRVTLSCNIPLIFGILTVENEAQALARVGGEYGHKGVECADAALAMIKVIAEIARQRKPNGV